VSAPAPQGRILVSLATYNERDNLTALIQEIHAAAPAVDVLVIDDNSPDGTGQLAGELAARDSRIHLVQRSGKLGLGTAILAGMHYALDHEYDCFVTMDADFSHHPRYLPALFAGMDDHDVMIGSRYVPGGGTENWPWSRKFMSWGVNTVVRLLMRIPAHDTSGGFRCYRLGKLRGAELNGMLSRGYSFQEELLYRCRRAGCRIGEAPIIFENRRSGTSKVNQKEVIRSIGVILWIGLRALFGLDAANPVTRARLTGASQHRRLDGAPTPR
jgi:dolichol-phosphate mannosyltransferase